MFRKSPRPIDVRGRQKRRKLDRQHPPPSEDGEICDPEVAAAQAESLWLAETSPAFLLSEWKDLLKTLSEPENADIKEAFLVLDGILSKHLPPSQVNAVRMAIVGEARSRLSYKPVRSQELQKLSGKTFVQMTATAAALNLAKDLAKDGYEAMRERIKHLLTELHNLL